MTNQLNISQTKVWNGAKAGIVWIVAFVVFLIFRTAENICDLLIATCKQLDTTVKAVRNVVFDVAYWADGKILPYKY